MGNVGDRSKEGEKGRGWRKNLKEGGEGAI